MTEEIDWQRWKQTRSDRLDDQAADWIELSHVLHPDLPGIDYFPPARFDRLMSMPPDRLNLTQMNMVCHFGTHVDAPCHFISEGPSIDEIPLDRFCGSGVVWRIEVAPFGRIDSADFEAATPVASAGDIVLLDTGWSEGLEPKAYAEHPSLTESAADWLVEKEIKLLGLDFPTPDLAAGRRSDGFDWPVHRILLGHGVLIAENLTGLAPLSGSRIEVMFLPIRIKGADGAPAIVLARQDPNRNPAARHDREAKNRE